MELFQYRWKTLSLELRKGRPNKRPYPGAAHEIERLLVQGVGGWYLDDSRATPQKHRTPGPPPRARVPDYEDRGFKAPFKVPRSGVLLNPDFFSCKVDRRPASVLAMPSAVSPPTPTDSERAT